MATGDAAPLTGGLQKQAQTANGDGEASLTTSNNKAAELAAAVAAARSLGRG